MHNVKHENFGAVSLTYWDNAKGETQWLMINKYGAAYFPTNEALINAILKNAIDQE